MSNPKAKHTPGPWLPHAAYGRGTHTDLISLGNSVASESGINIAHIDDDKEISYDYLERRQITDANTRLISAAPELLEIARAYRNLLKTAAHTEGEVATYSHIESVISKATGGGK